jgi:PAS domain S-box-containing protein
MNLLARLFLLVAIAVLPAIAIEAYTQYDLRRTREAELRESALRQTRLVSAEFDRIIEGARQLLIALAHVPAARRGDAAECNAVFEAVQKQYPNYASIGVFDRSGRLWCHSRRGVIQNQLGIDRPHFQEAVAAKQFSIGEYAIGRATSARILQFGYPVLDDAGEVTGVVFTGLDLDWLDRYLNERNPPGTSSLVVTDRNGTIIGRVPDGAKWIGQPLPDSLQPMLNVPNDGTVDLTGPEGVEEIVGYNPVALKPDGVFIAVGLAKAAALVEIDRATEIGILLMAASFVLALALAWIFGERVVRQPIAALTTAAARWREGDYRARAAVRPSGSEMSQLGAAFNAMAATIEARDQQLREAEERALRREREFSRLVIESSTQGIIGCDRDLVVTLWNPAIATYFGLTSEAAVGKKLFDMLPSLGRTPFGHAMRQALAGEETAAHVAAYELRETERSGLYDANFAPLRGEGDEIIGAIAFIADTTEWQEMEERLRQSQKMEAVGQLTGGIAHDFNNLLTVIIGNLDLLARRATSRESELARLAESALRGANRAATLTQRLLAFSRRQPLDPRIIDLNKLVTGMSDLLRRTLGETIAVETVLAAGLWRSRADPNQLENALLNLVINARDAMPGGGRLTIETGNAMLDETYAASEGDVRAGQYVMLAVSDTGAGMSAEIVGKAFEPFFTTKAIGEGSGLGLSMVYGFVKQSNGHVKIYSEPGAGTTVKIYLPRHFGRTKEAEDEAPRAAGTRTLSRERVLLVEDDVEVRVFAASVMRDLGYEVLEAVDGTEALRLIEAQPALDLLFTDVGLPGMNGRSLAEAALRLRPGLKILYTTGYARNAIVHNGVLDPDVELIGKPFDAETLAWRLRQVLEAT